MKTLSKKLKATQNKLEQLKKERNALENMLKNKTKELKKAEAKVKASTGMICALSSKIGASFTLTENDLKNPPVYVCRITETGEMEFKKKTQEC
ncbi:MAG: hypothetical protein Q4C84_15995 [Bacillota bacterium]|nr:hypothetical protein [Bacillota bacterium]